MLSKRGHRTVIYIHSYSSVPVIIRDHFVMFIVHVLRLIDPEKSIEIAAISIDISIDID